MDPYGYKKPSDIGDRQNRPGDPTNTGLRMAAITLHAAALADAMAARGMPDAADEFRAMAATVRRIEADLNVRDSTQEGDDECDD